MQSIILIIGSVYEFTAAQTNELKAQFKNFDKNHDGTLSVSEFATCMRALPLGTDVTDQDIENTFAASDIDRNGKIDFDEFAQYVGKVFEGIEARGGSVQWK